MIKPLFTISDLGLPSWSADLSGPHAGGSCWAPGARGAFGQEQNWASKQTSREGWELTTLTL